MIFISEFTHVENFKTSNVEHTDEMGSLQSSGIESSVAHEHKPLEQTIEETLGNGTNGVRDLVNVPSLGDELVADLDLGLAQVSVQVNAVNSEKFTDDFTSLCGMKLIILCVQNNNKKIIDDHIRLMSVQIIIKNPNPYIL